MKTALIVIAVIVVILAIVIGCVVWKLNHLVTPELVEATMSVYRQHIPKIDAPMSIDSVTDLGVLTSISSAIAGKDPITVTAARLNGEEITLITLGGTQQREGQATTMDESKLASDGKSNDYLKAVLGLFENGTVPRGKPILVSGISLGGMIAQQLIGESIVMDNYTIKAVITFGSPITKPFDRKGVRVVRFTDENDIVPKLGLMGMKKTKEDKETIKALDEVECIMKKGAHKDGIETHALSYISDPVWDEYDILGEKGGTCELETLAPIAFYPAPKLTDKQ